MIKALLFIATLLLTITSCTYNYQNSKESSPIYIDKNSISEIRLLVADTSIIDLPSKQLTKLIDVGEGQSFVDSLGNPFCKPAQIILFKASSKDSLVDVFNSFLDSSKQDTSLSSCIILYNHVFLLYNKNNKLVEQIDFAFDCPMQIDYLHRGKVVKVQDENSKLIVKLVNNLKAVNAYIPAFGPPPNP